MDGARTGRLIALLSAQRRAAARRSAEVRGSPGWSDASEHLDALNAQIMRFGTGTADTLTGEIGTRDSQRAHDPVPESRD